MESMDGDLNKLMQKNIIKFDIKIIKTIYKDICNNLILLHKKNMIHRDIKIDNVLYRLL